MVERQPPFNSSVLFFLCSNVSTFDMENGENTIYVCCVAASSVCGHYLNVLSINFLCCRAPVIILCASICVYAAAMRLLDAVARFILLFFPLSLLSAYLLFHSNARQKKNRQIFFIILASWCTCYFTSLWKSPLLPSLVRRILPFCVTHSLSHSPWNLPSHSLSVSTFFHSFFSAFRSKCKYLLLLYVYLVLIHD